MANPYLVELEKQRKLLAQRQAEAANALKSNYTENVNTINRNNDIASKQAYVNYKQNERALPEELARVGVTGGASESALIKLKNAYTSALERLSNQKNADLGTAENKYNVNLANTNNEYARQLAGIEQAWNDKAIRWQQQQEEEAKRQAEAQARYARAYGGGGGGGRSYGRSYGSSNDLDTMSYTTYSAPQPTASKKKAHPKSKSASGGIWSSIKGAFKKALNKPSIDRRRAAHRTRGRR